MTILVLSILNGSPISFIGLGRGQGKKRQNTGEPMPNFLLLFLPGVADSRCQRKKMCNIQGNLCPIFFILADKKDNSKSLD